MAAKASREELQREIDYWKRGGQAREIAPTVRTAIICATLLGIAWLVKETALGVAHELAGKDTHADVVYSVLANLNFSMTLSWACAVTGTGLAIRERRLRKKDVERLSKRVADLESDIDPKRTSSHLTPSGDTNPEDA